MSSCHLFGGPFRGVTFGGSGVSVGGVRSLRVLIFNSRLDFQGIAEKTRFLEAIGEMECVISY